MKTFNSKTDTNFGSNLMKAIFSLILMLSLCLILAPADVRAAEGDIAINEDNFPDEELRTILKDYFGSDVITAETAANTIRLEISGGEVHTFDGLEKLTKLDTLIYSGFTSSNMTLRGNPTLVNAYFRNSDTLVSLDVLDCPALEDLALVSTPATRINISDCPTLNTLQVQYNQLRNLDVSSCPSLKWLHCMNNRLENLNVKNCPILKTLQCEENQLQTLDVSDNTALQVLKFTRNQISNIDVSNNTALESLWCANNQLKSLNVSNNTELKVLRCDNNQITGLDVSNCSKLEELDCLFNELTQLKLGSHEALAFASVWHNKFTKLDISRCPILCGYVKTGTKTQTSTVRYDAPSDSSKFLEYDLIVELTYDDGVIPAAVVSRKKDNTITAKDITRNFSTSKQTFSIGAKALGGAALTYKSSNSTKISVDKAGKITVKASYVGKATITITAAETDQYNKATLKIQVRVNPGKATLLSVTNPAKGKITLKWKKTASTKATGYQIQYSTSSKYTKATTKSVKVKGIKTLTKSFTKLKKGKTYYVRIRTYHTAGSDTFYSPWSAKKIVIKK